MAEVTTPCPLSSTALLDGDLPRQLHRALDWALDTRLFTHLTPHRNTSWTFPNLILLILLWVWSERHTLTGAFQHASQLGQMLLGKIVLKTYPGFIDAVTTWTSTLMPLLWACLQKRMETIGGAYWRIGRWLPLAVDGSRTTTPRTKKNETALCPRRLGQGSTAKSRRKWKNKRRRQKKLTPVHPQIWLTLLWHMGLKMPWAWQEGPSNSSEREHLMQLLETQKFPEKTLFCGDAGFVGYDLWQAMARRGHHFLMRVGNNIRLLRNLGDTRVHGDLVHLWPRAIAAKNQPPMALRLLKFQIGQRVMYAVTNVLAERDMTAAQAKKLYRARWGVEVQFRSLKQTFGRGKLHSRTPDRAYGELAWSLLGLWLIQLLTAAEQIPAGVGPERSSVSVAIQVVRDAMARGRSTGLKHALRDAVKDTYKRGSKKARYRPKTKDKPSAGKPKVVMANADERRKYHRLIRVE